MIRKPQPTAACLRTTGPAAVNGESMQKSRTSQLIFSVRYLVRYLSAITALPPGDIIFAGTPRRVSWVEGIGTIRQDVIAAS